MKSRPKLMEAVDSRSRQMARSRRAIIFLAIFVVQPCEKATAQNPLAGDLTPTPVLLELFTSQGCPNCPPAERNLSNLSREQPVEGVELVTLEWHVDYFNNEQWTDSYSSPSSTLRQTRYNQVFEIDNYTPQMVMDGRIHFNGHNDAKAKSAAFMVSMAPKPVVQVEFKSVYPDLVRPEVEIAELWIRINGPLAPPPGDKLEGYVIIAEDKLSLHASAGSNKGRLLQSDSVVRLSTSLAEIDEKKEIPFEGGVFLELPDGLKEENLRAVVFVQDRDSRRIRAVGMAALSETS